MSEPVQISESTPKAPNRADRFGGPGPGRPKGSVDKTTKEVRAAAQALVNDPDYRDSLRTRLRAGLAPHMETLLWHYAYGKPTERVEVKDTTGELEGITAAQLRERAMVVAQRIREDEASVH